ncbi:MAG: hypothetical protein R2731_13185 [Nocardioides sp.]
MTGATALAALVAVLLLAGPAQAAPPEGWSDPKPVSTLHALIVYVFAPLGLAGLTVLGALLPSLARGQRSVSPLATESSGLDLLADDE